ncbi:MAG TPA: hypothetical protein VI542_12730 [Candidatus Tectomicrobia bacterium]
MGRPRLYATSVERKAAWRRRHGMAARPHYPSAAAKQAAYRARKRQAAKDQAARECAAIQQALQTRALADQCWELYELIDAWSRDPDHAAPGLGGPPSRAPGRCERPLLRGGCGARAPASAGAPAPGARQASQRSPRGRTERRGTRQSTGVCAYPPHNDRGKSM